MKRYNRLPSLLLTLALLLALLPLPAAHADQSGTTGACTWRLSGTTLIISGSGAMADYSDSDNPPWINWDDDDIDAIPNITGIRVESGVTHIGDYAFCYLSRVTWISIADTVTSIGRHAISRTKLTSLTIPRSVKTLGEGAVSDNYRLAEITVEPGNTAFAVSDGMLFSRDGKTLYFCPCPRTGDVTVPDTVTAIAPYAFCGSYVTSVTMPEGLRTIGAWAFERCHSMTRADIPSTVTAIGDHAFGGCSRLTRVTIPVGVTEIGPQTFDNTAALPRIDVAEGNPALTSYDGVLLTKDLKRLICAPTGYRGVFVAPPELRTADTCSFLCVSGLTGVVLRAGVTLKLQAFYSCSGVKALILDAGVDPVTNHPFAGTAPSDIWYLGTQSQWDALGADGWLAAAALHLVTAPVMAIQPADDTVFVSQTAVFSAAVAGGDVASVQWYYRSADGSSSGKSRMEGNDTNNLRVLANIKGDGRQYRMVATLRDGTTLTSDWATLHVDPDPRITAQPSDATASAGGRVVFRVAAVTGTGSLAYRWQYLTPGGTVWRDSSMSGSATAELRLSATEARNGQRYRCVVSNANGGETVSDAATLTVVSKPVITAQPASRTARVGETVKFTVKATDAAAYQWYYRTGGSGTWTKCAGTGYNTAALTVEAKNYRSGYQYRCRVSNAVGYAESDAATLTVVSKPVITAQPVSRTARAGETVKFTVKAAGAALTYQWYYQMPGGTWQRFDGGASATLTLTALSYRSGYRYRCRVSNAAGYVYSNAATLTVTG